MTAPPPRGAAARAALLAFLACLALFAWRAAPGVSFEDSGELAAAAATLGVPHPPGYPLFALVGHAWIALAAPFTDDAARALNLLSAVCGAGAAALLAASLRRTGGSLAAGLATAGLLALAPTFAAQAVVTEVYALLAFLTAAVLVAQRAERPLLACALWGLACTAHPGGLLLAPLALVAVARAARDPSTTRGPLALRAALAFALPLLLYLYVPLAAASDPPVNWGDVQASGSLADHLLRTQYRTGLERDWPALVAFVAAEGLAQWPLATLAGLLALAALHRSLPRGASGPLALASAFVGAGLLLSINYPLEPAARVRLAGSMTPLIVLVAALVGAGLAAIERRLAPRVPGWLPAVALLALSLVPGSLVPRARTLAGAVDRRGDTAAADYAAETLAACPPDAILLVGRLGYGDVLAFPLLYLQVVRGARPDVLVIERSLLEAAWYRAQLARRHPDLAGPLARLDVRFASTAREKTTARDRRRLSVPFLQELFDGPRPVVSVHRPGALLLDGRAIAAGPVLWRIYPAGGTPHAVATLPPPSDAPAAQGWLPERDRDPWTLELRQLARERDRARASALASAGRDAAARALLARWE